MAGPALLLCAIPKCAVQRDGKIFGKNMAGDCGAPLSNLIAEYLFFSLLSLNAQGLNTTWRKAK